MQSAKRQLADGVYVKGTVNGVSLTFTADTGASNTIISRQIYESIPLAARPKLVEATCLVGAGGTLIEGAGKASFDLKLGPLEMVTEAIVANIGDEALLGCDVLNGDILGPADILLSQNEVRLGGVRIPVFQVRKDKETRRVTLADNVCIPGMTEAVVSVHGDSSEGGDIEKADLVITPTEGVTESYPLEVVATLMNTNPRPNWKVRLKNTCGDEAELRSVTVIEKAERKVRVNCITTEVEDRMLQLGQKPAEIRKIGVMPKSEKKFSRPFMMRVKRPKFTFVNQIHRKNKERLVCHSKLNKYEGENHPKWVIMSQKRLKSQ